MTASGCSFYESARAQSAPVFTWPFAAGYSRRGIRRVGAAVLVVVSVAACSHSATAPPSPTQIVFVAEPTNAVAGQLVSVQVAIEDAAGQVVSNASDVVTLTLGHSPSGATLLGTTSIAAVNGVAAFTTLRIDKASVAYTLLASTSTVGQATSSAFTVLPGPPAQLVFTTQPAVVAIFQPMRPNTQVALEDAVGNVETSFTGLVSLGLNSSPSQDTLYGVVAVQAANGIATFSDLGMTVEGTFAFTASTSSFTALSAPFIVGTTGVELNGGAVIHTPKVAAIYWSPSTIYAGDPTPGTTGTGSQDQSLMGGFLRSFGGSPFFNILTTYYDTSGAYVQNVLTYTQYWADSTVPDTLVSDSGVRAEVERALTTGALTYDVNTIYAVFSGPSVNLGGGFGLGGYCAYHSDFVDGMGRDIKYATMPYAADFLIQSGDTASRGCAISPSPNSDPAADWEIDGLTHELAETITDEHLTDGWRDYLETEAQGQQGEIGDLCEGQYGQIFGLPNGSVANQSLGGQNFIIQMLWVNAMTPVGTPLGCQQNWTTPATARPFVRRAPLFRRLPDPITRTRRIRRPFRSTALAGTKGYQAVGSYTHR